MLGTLNGLTLNRDGTQNVTVTISDDFSVAYDALRNGPVTIEIKKASGKRSKSANDFCWALCTDIGKALDPPLSKEEVYRTAIRAVGVYTPAPVKDSDVDTVRRRWEGHGTGWFMEIVDESKLEGYKRVNLYYGTSTYTKDEMKILLDWLVDQAKQMELAIPLSAKEEEELLERWGRK